jgi:hypothetical protein
MISEFGERFLDLDFASDSVPTYEVLFDKEGDFRFVAPRPRRRASPPGVVTSVLVDRVMEAPATTMTSQLTVLRNAAVMSELQVGSLLCSDDFVYEFTVLHC